MISQQTIINAPIEKVYNAYRNIENWKYALSDVLNIEVLYDDNIHQEFKMTVEREFKPETVRTIRFCKDFGDEKEITLFQPVPPPQFKSMTGKWFFKKINDNQTLLHANRSFEIKDDAQINKSSVINNLNTSLKNNLEFFKLQSEGIGKIRVSRLVKTDYKNALKRFWDIKNWGDIWTPIDSVEVNYDDNTNQDFSMLVWRNNIKEEVRTIRHKINEKVIDFNSIKPPPKLLLHEGKWIFEEHKNGTVVTSERTFFMDKKQLNDNYDDELKNYKYNLQNRLIQILESFQHYFDK
ncbi:SRPBCC family protein [Staphylococcus warneri]